MKMRTLIFAVVGYFYAFTLPILAEDHCRPVRELLTKHYSESDQQTILSELDLHKNKFQTLGIEKTFCEELQKDFNDKFPQGENPLKLSVSEVINRGIRYESFRMETYLSSGVSPKRYFGFFDERGSTDSFEKKLRETAIDAARLANTQADNSALKFHITEKEIVVTFLAEGGALQLTNPEYSANRIHPVRGVGLDNFRLGFKRFPQLVKDFDNFFGTNLQGLLISVAGKEILTRPMTFREAVLGTAIMYLYEKELTAAFMRRDWGVELMSLPLPEQFIATSLVYNCGMLFARERVQQIAQFATGEYIAEQNEKSNRPKLALFSPSESLRRLKEGQPLPQQLTSWSAVYHILQRYGAWVALDKFSNNFEDGHFVMPR